MSILKPTARAGRLLLAVVVAFTPFGYSAVAHGQTAAQLWNNNCVSCHGKNAQGGNASSMLDDEWLTGPTDRILFDATKNGIVESGMPAYGGALTDEQIWSLVVHVRELRAANERARTGSPKPDRDGVYATAHERFRVERVITRGLDTPWSVDFVPAAGPEGSPSGVMLVTSRSGALQVWAGESLSSPVAGVPAVRNRGQGGLMDVAVHPEYRSNGWVYLTFSDAQGSGPRGPGFTKVVRGRIKGKGSEWRWTDEETIFEAKSEHYSNGDIHFGSRIVFEHASINGADPEWLVYFCMGERGVMDLAQRLDRPNGKIFRFHDDGRIPADNPFVGQSGVYEAIWSYGHRNPQGLAFGLDGRLWDTEHGPRGGDELNLVQRGKNYGWPLVSFGINYSDAPFRTPWPTEGQDFVMPVYVWLPSIAACGLDTVRAGPDGEAFPAWRGDLVAGGLAGQTVERLRIEGESVVEREELIHGMGRVRDVVTGPDGSIYVVLNQPDHVIRIVPAK